MNDEELEALFRDTLSAHADDVTDPGGRAEAAYAGVRRRRRLRTGVVGGVVAVALVPVAVVSAVVATHPHPSSWRAESYNGVQLLVPSSWGWGGVPQGSGGKALVQCGVGAFSTPTAVDNVDGAVFGDSTAPYVGRPIMMSDVCGTPVAEPSHVWFDSPLPAGPGPLGTTRWVHGNTRFKITVGDDNSVERAAILRSIARVAVDANGCPATVTTDVVRDLRPPSGVMVHHVSSLSVCLYEADRGRWATGDLLYSSRVGSPVAQQTVDAILSVQISQRNQPPSDCPPQDTFSFIDLRVQTTGGTLTFTVYLDECSSRPLLYQGWLPGHPVTKGSVRLWAVNAVPLYARGGSVGNRLTPYLPR